MQSSPEDVSELKKRNILSLHTEEDHKSSRNIPQRSRETENASSKNHLNKYEAAAHDSLPTNSSSKSLLSIGAFTIQCSRCMQWRLIPTQEKYEEIRERILQEHFHCENAQEWHPTTTCSDPSDVTPDRGGLWAIDKHNIPQSPQGWRRILKFRGEGGTRFADVYYVSPTGKRLRSKIEVERYLLENPDYELRGIDSSKFSFQTPRPLQENYVRKKIQSENAHEGLSVALIDGNEALSSPANPEPLSSSAALLTSGF